MPAINFQPEFASSLLGLRKRQTIRETAKMRAGDVLHLYTGMRTKSCKFITSAVCKGVQAIILTEKYAQPHGSTVIMGHYLEEFAIADGFKTYAEMWSFFKSRADENGEFNGFLIKW